MLEQEIKRTPPRIHINEIMISNNFTPEQKAGFMVFLGSIRYLRQEEWELKIKEYLNR